MIRDALHELKKWKDEKKRKPLIIEGARQVGKTWLMKEFGVRYFSHTAYFMFEHNNVLQSIFQKDLNPRRILEELGYLFGKPLTPETLIILDEIQACPAAVTALKFLNEEYPDYPIVAAGSYLGLATHRGLSFPVGKVDFLTLRPLHFLEFLSALGHDFWRTLIEEGDFERLRILHDPLMNLVRKYLYIGGMPEAVQTFVESDDLNRVRSVQNAILKAYEDDFSKHIPSTELAKVRLLWQSIPGQLAKENRKLTYSTIRKGSRAKEYEDVISWLSACGLIHQVFRVKKPGLPLSAYADITAFKLFPVDVGLLSAQYQLPSKALLGETTILEEFKGSLAEHFVLQEILASTKMQTLYYWSNESSTAEIDFLIQGPMGVIPIEVKSGINLKAKSLKFFIEKYAIQQAIRFSAAHANTNEGLRDLPLYSVSTISRTLDT